MIPEFLGRLPVLVTLSELDEAALVRVLKEPKNALSKQYQRLFAYERVQLTFSEDALAAVAQEAIKRKTGARGLRAILEDVMLETMYELPGMNHVKELIVDATCIRDGAMPKIISLTDKEISERAQKVVGTHEPAPFESSGIASKGLGQKPGTGGKKGG
jgi:ATP-dependent Clp protease ATP-binding subunit ClpX